MFGICSHGTVANRVKDSTENWRDLILKTRFLEAILYHGTSKSLLKKENGVICESIKI